MEVRPEGPVAVKHCLNYSRSAVKRTIADMVELLPGGWSSLVPRNAAVLIKPNLLKAASADQVVSPHPEVVRAVAELCRDSGAGTIIIGDSPGIGTAHRVAEKCGILDAARSLGIQVVDFSESVTVPAAASCTHTAFAIAREAAEAEVIINLPKFKTHAMMLLTLAVKNMYGVFVGKQKARWHFQSGKDHVNFARLLVELAYTVQPAVSILDAVVGMEGNGPGSGTPRQLGFLAAARGMSRLDRVAVEIAGVDPKKLLTLEAAEAMGIPATFARSDLVGDAIDPLMISDLKMAAPMHIEGPAYMKPLSWLVKRYVTVRPSVDAALCRGCGVCADACPACCISLNERTGSAHIDHSTCIRCFCCQELCPEGAVCACEPIGVKMLKRLHLE